MNLHKFQINLFEFLKWENMNLQEFNFFIPSYASDCKTANSLRMISLYSWKSSSVKNSAQVRAKELFLQLSKTYNIEIIFKDSTNDS